MARTAREKSATGMYSVVLKAYREIFAQKEDREEFLRRLEGVCDVLKSSFEGDTAFLEIKESADGISSDMKRTVTSFARYYNKKYGLSGRLFDGRFKSKPIDDEHGKAVYPTVNKPVRAKQTRKKTEPKKTEPKKLPTWLL